MTAYNFQITTGTVTVDTTSLQTDVDTEYQNALGQTINLAASTPQGTLINAEVIARAFVMKNNSDLANTINPDLSYGVFLDAICALMGISRGINRGTLATSVQIIGVPLTVITAGVRVQSTAGDVFTIVNDVTIPVGGTTIASIISSASGPIPLALGAMSILDGVLGWNSITVLNTSIITLGTLALSDNQLKIARKQQLAKQGVESSSAIIAAVGSLANVTSVNVVENNTGAAGLVNGITFTLPNAMWVCVDGGATQAAIAQALYSVHSAGLPWDYATAGNGNPVNSPNGVSVIDPSTGLTYNVKYTTPILYDAYCLITVHQIGSSAAPTNAVQVAITNYTNGLESGEAGLVIGASVSAFEYAGAVARQIPGLYIKSCSIAVVPAGSTPPLPGAYTSEFVMPPYGRARQAPGNIAVTVI